jgi:hypothetical protein
LGRTRNEYVGVLVDDGMIGLAVFLTALVLVFQAGRRTMEGALVMLAPLVPENAQIMRNLG